MGCVTPPITSSKSSNQYKKNIRQQEAGAYKASLPDNQNQSQDRLNMNQKNVQEQDAMRIRNHQVPDPLSSQNIQEQSIFDLPENSSVFKKKQQARLKENNFVEWQQSKFRPTIVWQKQGEQKQDKYKLQERSKQQIVHNFQYYEKQPFTLTMTFSQNKSSQRIRHKAQGQTLFVWIDNNAYRNSDQGIFIEKNLDTQILCYQNTKQGVKAIKDKIKEKISIIVICSLSFAEDIQRQLGSQREVQKIVCYCQKEEYYYKKKENNQLGIKFVFGTNSIALLVEALLNLSRPNNIEKRVDLQGYFSCQSWLTNTLYSMNYLKTNTEQIKKQLIITMQNHLLADKVKSEVINRIENMRYQDKNKIGEWLSKAAFYNIIKDINNLILSISHPSQIFMIQPLFKDLFQCIRFIFKYMSKSIKCEKWLQIPQENVKYYGKIGSVVQTLNFMECIQVDKKSKVSQKKGNVRFFINLDIKNGHQDQKDYGFFQIQDKKVKQNNIFFNPLNYFEVVRFEKDKDSKGQLFYDVQLLYPTNKKKSIDQPYIPRSMGEILVNANSNLECWFQYWTKFKQLCTNYAEIDYANRNLEIGFRKWALNGIEQSCIEQANQIQTQIIAYYLEIKDINKCFKVYKMMSKGGGSIQDFQLCLNNLKKIQAYCEKRQQKRALYRQYGYIYFKLKQYQRSIQYFQQYQETFDKCQQFLELCNVKYFESVAFKEIRKYDEALDYIESAEKLFSKILKGKDEKLLSKIDEHKKNLQSILNKKGTKQHTRVPIVQQKGIKSKQAKVPVYKQEALIQHSNFYRNYAEKGDQSNKFNDQGKKCIALAKNIQPNFIQEKDRQLKIKIKKQQNLKQEQEDYQNTIIQLQKALKNERGRDNKNKIYEIEQKLIDIYTRRGLHYAATPLLYSSLASIQNKKSLNMKTKILMSIGHNLLSSGQYQSALSHYQANYNFIKQNNSFNSFAVLLGCIGITHVKMSNYDQAIKYLNSCQTHLDQNAKKSSQKNFKLLIYFAAAHIGKKQYDLALKNLRQAQQVLSYQKNAQKQTFFQLYNHFGVVYTKIGKSEHALEYFEKLIDKFSSPNDRKHPKYGTLLNNIGNIHLKEKRYDKAQAKYKQALQVYNSYEQNYINLRSAILYNIGLICCEKGNIKEARIYLTDCLSIQKSTLSESHPSYLRTLKKIYSLQDGPKVFSSTQENGSKSRKNKYQLDERFVADHF